MICSSGVDASVCAGKDKEKKKEAIIEVGTTKRLVKKEGTF
jgi:hypothetical protein